MDDLRFYALFNNISVITGRRVGDDERLCAFFLAQRQCVTRNGLYSVNSPIQDRILLTAKKNVSKVYLQYKIERTKRLILKAPDKNCSRRHFF